MVDLQAGDLERDASGERSDSIIRLVEACLELLDRHGWDRVQKLLEQYPLLAEPVRCRLRRLHEFGLLPDQDPSRLRK